MSHSTKNRDSKPRDFSIKSS